MWVTWVTWFFLAVIVAVVVVAWLVSSGRIHASMEDPYGPGIEWHEQNAEPPSDGAPSERPRPAYHPTRREHADGRHEAQDW